MKIIGKCSSRPIKYDYLYVDNIKDNIESIISFFKEQSGRDYKYDINQHIFSVHNAHIKNDIYNFYASGDSYNDIIYMEDTNNYIIFDKDYNKFEIYSVGGFNDSFKLINDRMKFNGIQDYIKEEFEFINRIEDKLGKKVMQNLSDYYDQYKNEGKE